MARVDTLVHFLTDVADSIRAKKGTSGAIQASDFDTEIASISSGGVTPTKGFTVDEWDNDGNATKISLYGFTTIPDYVFSIPTSNPGIYGKNLQNVVFIGNPTSIGKSAFSNCKQLSLTELPSTVTSIGQNAFMNCTKLALTNIPDNLPSIEQYTFSGCVQLAIEHIKTSGDIYANAFSGCTSLKKVCIEKARTIAGTNSTGGAFYNCTGLKQVWLNGINQGTAPGLDRYSFAGCSALEKMYINAPRATVEALTNYQYAFMNNTNKTGIIVCNDDEGFLTKEQFEATDWSSV